LKKTQAPYSSRNQENLETRVDEFLTGHLLAGVSI
jgi:hypothetical protein